MTFPAPFCQGTAEGDTKDSPSSVSQHVWRTLLVDRNLVCRLLQLDGKFVRRLVDIKVLSVGAEAGGNHLDAHFAVRNTSDLGFAVLMGLELQSLVLLVALLVDGMQDNFRIAHGPSVGVPHYDKAQVGGLRRTGFACR